MNNIIEINGVSKIFTTEKGQQVEALQKVDLGIDDHQFVCLLGPSGSGKSTLLRLMAGLIKASSGEIKVMGKKVEKPIKEASMVFQEYSLLPWRTVIDNVAFGLELRQVAKQKRYEEATVILDKFGLKGFENSFPYELSGGMRQRVAIARAMAISPKILYMDEPFGALDAHTRIQMQQDLLNFWLKDRKTIIFVTHSVEEAIFLGTRVIVMSARPGRIVADFQLKMDYPRNRLEPEFQKVFMELMDLMNG